MPRQWTDQEAQEYKTMYGQFPSSYKPKTAEPRALTETERSAARIGLQGWIPGVDEQLRGLGLDWSTTTGRADSTRLGLIPEEQKPKTAEQQLSDRIARLKLFVSENPDAKLSKGDKLLLGNWMKENEIPTESIPDASTRILKERRSLLGALPNSPETIEEARAQSIGGDGNIPYGAAERVGLKQAVAKEDTLRMFEKAQKLMPSIKNYIGDENAFLNRLTKYDSIIRQYNYILSTSGKDAADAYADNETGGVGIDALINAVRTLKE